MKSARCGGCSTSGAASRWPETMTEARRVPLRRHLAVRVPRVRAVAAGARRHLAQRRLPARALRRPARALGAEGPGRDRAEARMDLPPRVLAGAPAPHRDA